MRNWSYLLVATALFAMSCAEPHTDSSTLPEAVVEKMARQEAAWNIGDLEAFMEAAYWKDERLVFVGSKGPTYGYEATLSNYLKSYDSPEAMGTLSFELIEWRSLGQNHGYLLGKWGLQRGEDLGDLNGHFTLVWEHQPNAGWVIIADHSS